MVHGYMQEPHWAVDGLGYYEPRIRKCTTPFFLNLFFKSVLFYLFFFWPTMFPPILFYFWGSFDSTGVSLIYKYRMYTAEHAAETDTVVCTAVGRPRQRPRPHAT